MRPTPARSRPARRSPLSARRSCALGWGRRHRRIRSLPHAVPRRWHSPPRSRGAHHRTMATQRWLLKETRAPVSETATAIFAVEALAPAGSPASNIIPSPFGGSPDPTTIETPWPRKGSVSPVIADRGDPACNRARCNAGQIRRSAPAGMDGWHAYPHACQKLQAATPAFGR